MVGLNVLICVYIYENSLIFIEDTLNTENTEIRYLQNNIIVIITNVFFRTWLVFLGNTLVNL